MLPQVKNYPCWRNTNFFLIEVCFIGYKFTLKYRLKTRQNYKSRICWALNALFGYLAERKIAVVSFMVKNGPSLYFKNSLKSMHLFQRLMGGMNYR